MVKDPVQFTTMKVEDEIRFFVALLSLLIGLIIVGFSFYTDSSNLVAGIGWVFIGFFVAAFKASFKKRSGQEGLTFCVYYLVIYWSKIISFSILFFGLLSLFRQIPHHLFRVILFAGNFIFGAEADYLELNNLISLFKK